MKKEFYRTLQENKERQDLVLLTIVAGKNKGEKILLSGNMVIGTDGIMRKEDSFLFEKRETLLPLLTSKLVEVEGNKIYCEKIGSQPHLIICGGGHVSNAILQIGKMIGFTITVIEDRLSFANEAIKTGADEVICDNFLYALSKIKSDTNTYFVVVTRGHKWDADCLREILKKEYAYVGMMGSKRRVTILKQLLEQEGYDSEKLAELHSPIGISIGAESPQEIAVSIWAEIIGERSGKKKSTGYDEKSLRILSGENEDATEIVLATIVARRGSAPREIGTKMIVFPDERIVGTIGGGCMESEVIRKARYMLGTKGEETDLIEVDMSGIDAQEEGMACGGTIWVNLEKLT